MKARIYGIRNCDTMKKAFAWLASHRVDYEFHDYKKAGWEKLANTRGPTWRKIPDAAKQDLDEKKMIGLLESNTSAIRRPIVEAGARVLIGFDPGEFSASLK